MDILYAGKSYIVGSSGLLVPYLCFLRSQGKNLGLSQTSFKRTGISIYVTIKADLSLKYF